MKVSAEKPFQIIYSLYTHQYLGGLIESFAVQLDNTGELSLLYQNIGPQNAQEFSSQLDSKDFELIQWIEAIQQDSVVKKFSSKRLELEKFFLTVYDKTQGDKALQAVIAEYLDSYKRKILASLKGRQVFEMGNDGYPAYKPVEVFEKKANTRFLFFKNENNTHYFPTIKLDGESLDFRQKNALVFCYKPAWMLFNNKLFGFEKELDGKKLIPFLKKKFIVIPPEVENDYYRKFVAPLIETLPVKAKGFQITDINEKPEPIIEITEITTEEEDKILVSLKFSYGQHIIDSKEKREIITRYNEDHTKPVFFKIKRRLNYESEIINTLKHLGLPFEDLTTFQKAGKVFSWVNKNQEKLKELGIQIHQSKSNKNIYFIGEQIINLKLDEKNDWFDIKAEVRFGEYKIPFVKLRKYILKGIKQFKLPNGELAVIPESWLQKYTDIIQFSEVDDQDREDQIKLKMHHFGLIDNLNDEVGNTSLNQKLSSLLNDTSIKETSLPSSFKGKLRSYQLAGYNWLQFLNQNNLGGCLADDMGLGKTIQTLAFIASLKDKKPDSICLLVMPTSLLYNWEEEAGKFTPSLKTLIYRGANRDESLKEMSSYDMIITSYGVLRLDIDKLSNFYFDYIILDESQAIKNPEANITASVNQLKSRGKLVLTGTPVENSTLDLWSQMNFINPGILGSLNTFKKNYLTPIEKKNDPVKREKLHAIVKPFILRREKSQVAKELPPKVEKVLYCEMSQSQAKKYEEIKSYYRNELLKELDEGGINKSYIKVLQGLSQLRQVANHPKMIDPTYSNTSGKLENILYTLEGIISKNHKVLIFSQFVKHLKIVKEELEERSISFNYLDGQTKNRKEVVDTFQSSSKIQVMLISLKAGGTGLNLTAADYVFILDPWWNPAVEAQAIDRAHRIGQTKTVFTYKFISKETVEEKILQLQKKKSDLAKTLISADESFVKKLTKEDIEKILT